MKPVLTISRGVIRRRSKRVLNQRRKLTEQAIDGTLRPIGFKKERLSWRRHCDGGIQQQFSLHGTGLGAWYNVEWKLKLRRREKPCEMTWHFQSIHNIRRRIEYGDAFRFALAIPDDERIRRIRALLRYYVIPCFKSGTMAKTVQQLKKPRSAP